MAAHKKQVLPALTRRWLLGGLLWMVVLLVLAGVGIAVFTRQSFYSSARQAIGYRMELVTNELRSAPISEEERRAYITSVVESFSEKDKFELLILDRQGRALVTSSGFSTRTVRPDDFVAALQNADGSGSYVGRSGQGENIMAMTQILPTASGDYYACRLVTSLSRVDAQLLIITAVIAGVVLLIILFSTITSVYFIRSLVVPIHRIGATARSIASGNFDVRVDTDYNDEINELCDQINEMARGLSETDRMKNEFISSVSHELRTPLTSIKGWGETLLAIEPDRETYEKGLRIILNETGRLSNMVEDLLDFSRMQQNKGLSFSAERLDLVAEVTEAVLIVDQRAARSGIRIDYAEPATAVPIDGDKNRLRQVFANVFDNAIKYSGEGKKITVRIEAGVSTASVVVTDEGIGIPPEDLPKITTRFYKAGNATTGSGIGLSVVSEIMNLHGGALEFQSELGKGTTVRLRFPLAGRKE
mgnify:FL=1